MRFMRAYFMRKSISRRVQLSLGGACTCECKHRAQEIEQGCRAEVGREGFTFHCAPAPHVRSTRTTGGGWTKRARAAAMRRWQRRCGRHAIERTAWWRRREANISKKGAAFTKRKKLQSPIKIVKIN